MLYAEDDGTEVIGRSLCGGLAIWERRDVLKEASLEIGFLYRKVEREAGAIVEASMDVATEDGRLDGLVHIDKGVLELGVAVLEGQLGSFQVLGWQTEAAQACQQRKDDFTFHFNEIDSCGKINTILERGVVLLIGKLSF